MQAIELVCKQISELHYKCVIRKFERCVLYSQLLPYKSEFLNGIKKNIKANLNLRFLGALTNLLWSNSINEALTLTHLILKKKKKEKALSLPFGKWTID